jgi:hypothetical protein
MEKNAFMPWIFSEADLDVMARVRSAIEPTGNLNPRKVLPNSETHVPAGPRAVAHRPLAEGMWV